MTDQPSIPDTLAYIDIVAPALGLAVREACRPGVALNLGLATGMAAMVMAVSLQPDDEPGPVFDPGATRDRSGR